MFLAVVLKKCLLQHQDFRQPRPKLISYCVIMDSFEKTLNKAQANDVALAEFECPICMNYMIPPIKSCKSGHNICYFCDRRLQLCPICRAEKDPSHNLGMETIFNNLVVPCLNSSRGCTVEVLGKDLKTHQRYCPFKIIRCPLRVLDNCEEKQQFRDIEEHCLKQHPSNVVCNNSMKFVWPRFRYTTVLRKSEPKDSYHVLCKAYGELFKCIWDMDMETGFMRWCVVYMGPISKINKYSFEICFENVEKPGEQIMRFRSCCHPEYQVLFQKDKYLSAHSDMLRKLCGSGGLHFTIIILEDGVMPVAGEEEISFVTPETSQFFDLNDASLVEVKALFSRINLNSEEERFDESF